LPLENLNQYCSLRSCIQSLDDKIEELDFSALLNYLEERYEKPYLKIAQNQESDQITKLLE